MGRDGPGLHSSPGRAGGLQPAGLGSPRGLPLCSLLPEPQGRGAAHAPVPSLGSQGPFVGSDESLGQGGTSGVDLGPAFPAAGLNLGSVLTLETQAYPPDPGHGNDRWWAPSLVEIQRRGDTCGSP